MSLDDLDLILETIDEAKPKVSRPTNIGLSQQQVMVHYDDLYLGYVKKSREIRAKLKKPSRATPSSIYTEYRSLKKDESYAVNAVRLHELYFDNLDGKSEVSSDFKAALKDSGWAFDDWKRDFVACAKASRGWAILAYDRSEKQFRNLMLDSHSEGLICCHKPILVLDMYEHAYVIDFKMDKEKYLNWFFDHIKWSEVLHRLEDTGSKAING